MGAVYLGYDGKHDRQVALKVLNDSLAAGQGYLDRFHREARYGQLLNHPNIVRLIDGGIAVPPINTMVAIAPPPVPSSDKNAAGRCLKVDSNGSHWGFRNACGYSVQFSYCTWRGSEPLAACDGAAEGAHAISGSVAANGLATLTTDTSFSEKNGEHDFRWVACDGGAGEVVAHLDRADPPSGRCERAAVATNRH